MRIKLVAAAIFVGTAIAGKVLTATAGVSSAAGPTDVASAAALVSTPTASPGPWEIAGTIQQMNGQFWEIQGFAVRVTSSTQVIGDVPSVGVRARAVGTVDSTGTWTATRVWVGRAADAPTSTPAPAAPTATSTDTAVPTLPASPTPAPSPTATQTPVPTATATSQQFPFPDPLGIFPPAPRPQDPGDSHHGKPRDPAPRPHPPAHGHGPQDKAKRHD